MITLRNFTGKYLLPIVGDSYAQVNQNPTRVVARVTTSRPYKTLLANAVQTRLPLHQRATTRVAPTMGGPGEPLHVEHKSFAAVLLPSIVSLTIVLTALQGVTLPLVLGLGFASEIDDRLLALN
jgi:hypothetical protein